LDQLHIPEELAFADKIMKENGGSKKGINGAIKPLEVKKRRSFRRFN
jgi:hypothetical protein